MWGSVLVVTLLSALNPVRIALTLLMASRLRPVQNLLALWAGCLTGAIFSVVVPLTLVHVTSMSESFGQGGAASSTVQRVQIGMGVLALATAALMTVRSLIRRRQPAQLPSQEATRGRHRKGGSTSTLVLESNTPTAISRLLGREHEAPAEGGSAFRRLLRRARSAWENGSIWIAYVIGLAFGGPQPDVALFVVAIIVGSGAAIAMQVVAATAFVFGTVGVIEIILVSYLITPAKTLAVLQRLHDWVSAHRQQILAAIFAVVGVALVANGMRGI
jgi:Sap-like sulfolipid-1-addressing protein